jgi:hypothetical protein
MALTSLVKIIATSRKEQIERLNICNLCENFKKEYKICDMCGCFMPLKSKIKQLSCPKGKW